MTMDEALKVQDIHDELMAEIKRLRDALQECAAPFDTGPTTIGGAANIVAHEFQRRMNIAGAALTAGERP